MTAAIPRPGALAFVLLLLLGVFVSLLAFASGSSAEDAAVVDNSEFITSLSVGADGEILSQADSVPQSTTPDQVNALEGSAVGDAPAFHLGEDERAREEKSATTTEDPVQQEATQPQLEEQPQQQAPAPATPQPPVPPPEPTPLPPPPKGPPSHWAFHTTSSFISAPQYGWPGSSMPHYHFPYPAAWSLRPVNAHNVLFPLPGWDEERQIVLTGVGKKDATGGSSETVAPGAEGGAQQQGSANEQFSASQSVTQPHSSTDSAAPPPPPGSNSNNKPMLVLVGGDEDDGVSRSLFYASPSFDTMTLLPSRLRSTWSPISSSNSGSSNDGNNTTTSLEQHIYRALIQALSSSSTNNEASTTSGTANAGTDIDASSHSAAAPTTTPEAETAALSSSSSSSPQEQGDGGAGSVVVDDPLTLLQDNPDQPLQLPPTPTPIPTAAARSHLELPMSAFVEALVTNSDADSAGKTARAMMRKGESAAEAAAAVSELEAEAAAAAAAAAKLLHNHRPQQQQQQQQQPLPVLKADKEKQDAVREAFLHSWRPYKEHAWGSDTLKPISKQSDNSFLKMGISMTDSLSTMAIMGLEDDFQQAVDWVSGSLFFDHQEDINLFEATIRVVGGLISAWELSGRKHPGLIRKARQAADAMLFAFDSPTGLPYGTLGLRSKNKYNPTWVQQGSTISEVATLQLEYEALSHITGDPKYCIAVRRVMSHLMLVEPSDGLYPMFISPLTGAFIGSVVTLGARADSLYEYLLKNYLLSGGLKAMTTAATAAATSATSDPTALPSHPSRPQADSLPQLVGNAAVLQQGVPLSAFAPPESSTAARFTWDSAAAMACKELNNMLWLPRNVADEKKKESSNTSSADKQEGQGEAVLAAAAAAAEDNSAAPVPAPAVVASPTPLPVRLWYACTDAELAPCWGFDSLADMSRSTNSNSNSNKEAAVAASAAAAAAPLFYPVSFPWHLGVDADACMPDINALNDDDDDGDGDKPEPEPSPSPSVSASEDTSTPSAPPSAFPSPEASPSLLRQEGEELEELVDVTATPLSEAAYFTALYGMYLRAVQGIDNQLLRRSKPSGFLFIAERHNRGNFDDKQDHLVCFMAGVLALGARVNPNLLLSARHLHLGRELLETCVQTYNMTATGLAPEITRFPNGGSDPIVDMGAKHNLLRPETVESLFVLYRLTGDERYREIGWRFFQAFEKHCRVEGGGFATLRDVTTVPAEKNDHQESFWLAETLKYFYLLFSDSSLIPLDEWVFNTEAHPLPVFGTRPAPATPLELGDEGGYVDPTPPPTPTPTPEPEVLPPSAAETAVFADNAGIVAAQMQQVAAAAGAAPAAGPGPVVTPGPDQVWKNPPPQPPTPAQEEEQQTQEQEQEHFHQQQQEEFQREEQVQHFEQQQHGGQAAGQGQEGLDGQHQEQGGQGTQGFA